MPLSVALAGTVVAQLFEAVYAGLTAATYDPAQRVQIALELTRLTVPLLTIQEEIPHELQSDARQLPVGAGLDGTGPADG